MLETQLFLNQYPAEVALDKLKEKYFIDHTLHNNDGRVILNYSQIESPKHHPIVKECRGLVLDRNNNWALVARSFPRFFNWEECPSAVGLFKWENCVCQDKEDGSLAILYHYNGEWHFNTRGSFGNGNVNGLDLTWREVFNLALNTYQKDLSNLNLNNRLTYIFELCTPYNKIVRDYPEPKLFLLTIFEGEKELSYDETVKVAAEYNLPVLGAYPFSGIEDVKRFIENISSYDPTFEGIVLRDRKNLRFKVKSTKYVELHRLNNNGNLVLPKNLINTVMDNDIDEVGGHFPHIIPIANEMKLKIENTYKQLELIYDTAKTLENQKEFAEFVLTQTEFSSILFQTRKTKRPLKEVFNESRDILLKKLF